MKRAITNGTERLAAWRFYLHDEMTQMRELGVSIPEKAFAICFVANPADYEGMNTSETVDCIIQLTKVNT